MPTSRDSSSRRKPPRQGFVSSPNGTTSTVPPFSLPTYDINVDMEPREPIMAQSSSFIRANSSEGARSASASGDGKELRLRELSLSDPDRLVVEPLISSAAVADAISQYADDYTRVNPSKAKVPAYVYTCLEEYSRNTLSYNLHPNAPNADARVPYDNSRITSIIYPSFPGDCSQAHLDVSATQEAVLREEQPLLGGRHEDYHPMQLPLLQHYHPGFDPSALVIKKPPSAAHREIIRDNPFDFHILFKLGPMGSTEDDSTFLRCKNFFEPLFASVSIYALIVNSKGEEEAVKVTESFHMDPSPKTMRTTYSDVYDFPAVAASLAAADSAARVLATALNALVPSAIAATETTLDLCDMSTTDGSKASSENSKFDPALDVTACMFSIPPSYARSSLFLVTQLSKVLTCDAEKAVSAYTKISSSDIRQTEEQSRRLPQYRQPVAISVFKIFDEKQSVARTAKTYGKDTIVLPFYAQKSSFNDAQLRMFIRDLYPLDGFAKARVEGIDIEMVTTLHDLGRKHEFSDRFPRVDGSPERLTASRSDDSPQGVAIRSSSPSPATPNSRLAYSGMCIVPSQFHEPFEKSTERNQISLGDFINKRLPAGALGSVLAVRDVMSLDAVRNMDERNTHMLTTLDHSIYIYPKAFERFQHRNLSLKVSLVELEAFPDDTTDAIGRIPRRELCNVYSNTPGPLFTTAAYTKVSYHNKSPTMNDEIKIRLPLVVSPNHYLVFEMHHIHVKPKGGVAARRGSLTSFLGFNAVAEDALSIVVARAFVPILQRGVKDDKIFSLVPDGEYTTAFQEIIAPEENESSNKPQKGGGVLFEPPLVKYAVKTKSSLFSTSHKIQPYLQSQEEKFSFMGGVVPSCSMNIVPTNEYALNPKRKRSSIRSTMSDLRVVSAIQSIPTAPKNELKLHFMVIMRMLLNGIVCGGVTYSHDFPIEDYSNPYYHPVSRCYSFLVLLYVFDKIESDSSKTLDELASPIDTVTANPSNSLATAYIDYMFDEEVYAVPRNKGRAPAAKSNSDNLLEQFKAKLISPSDEIHAERYEQSVVDHCTREVEAIVMKGLYHSVVESICDELMGEIDKLLSPSCSDSSIAEATKNIFASKSDPVLDTEACWMPPCRVLTAFKTVDSDSRSSVNKQESWTLEGVVKALTPRFNAAIGPRIPPAGGAPSSVSQRGAGSGEDDEETARNRLLSEDIQSLDLQDNGEERLSMNETGDPDVSVDGNPRKSLGSHAGISEVSALRRANSKEVQMDVDDAIDGHVALEGPVPIQQKPSLLHSYKERRAILHNIRNESNSTLSAEIPKQLMQWWPFMYEVLTHQWYWLLKILAAKDKDVKSKAEYSKDGSDLNLSSNKMPNEDTEDSETDESFQYPFTRENIPSFGVLRSGESSSDTLRYIALDMGPLLLRIISKSLALRIQRSGMRPPVMLDDPYLELLDKLVLLITKETASLKKGIVRHSRLNNALASFLKELIGMVALSQIERLVGTYIRTIRLYHGENVNIPDLRLKFLSTFVAFQEFSGAMNPLIIDRTNFPKFFQLSSGLNSKGDRNQSMLSPSYNWLPHLLIDELVSIYRTDGHLRAKMNGAPSSPITLRDVQGFRKRAVRILCEVFVRLAYDPNMQSQSARAHVVVAFLPLLKEIVKELSLLVLLRFDDVERKDFLIIFIHLIHDCPDQILRYMWRKMMREEAKFSQSRAIDSIFKIMHIALDTFMFPSSKEPIETFFGRVLSPTVAEEYAAASAEQRASGGSASVGSSSQAGANISAADAGSARASGSRISSLTAGVAQMGTTEALTRLETMMQGRRSTTSRVDNRRKTIGTPSRSGFDETPRFRKFDLKPQARTIRAYNTLLPGTMISATKGLCHQVSIAVLSSLQLMLEEIPLDKSLCGHTSRFSHSNVASSGAKWKQIDILQNISYVLLHLLSTRQSDELVTRVFNTARFIVLRFGIRLTMKAFGGTLQDWILASLIVCNSSYELQRNAACEFLYRILLECCRVNGSHNQISAIVFALIGDVVRSSRNKPSAARPSREFCIDPLKVSIHQIIAAADNTIASKASDHLVSATGLYAIKDFMSQCNSILDAYQCLSEIFVDFNNFASDEKTIVGDVNLVSELCWQCAQIFDAARLPHLKVTWLKYLARVHRICENSAELAEALYFIYRTMQASLPFWKELWAPRPPIGWMKSILDPSSSSPSDVDPSRGFEASLSGALRSKPMRPWDSDQKYRDDMIAALRSASNAFQAAHFYYIAEKVTLRLINIFSSQGEIDNMAAEYGRLQKLFTSTYQLPHAMGRFYRVVYLGTDIPKHLKKKEYIYRDGGLLHVSEFQSMIKAKLEQQVPKGVAVSVMPESTINNSATNLDEVPGAVVVLAPVKPIWGDHIPSDTNGMGEDELDSVKRSFVCRFHSSIPFTRSDKGPYAKLTSQQWRKITYLSVRNAFPFVTLRQPISLKEDVVLRPIEVGIYDLEDCIAQMKDEVMKPVISRDSSEASNLKRFVQGTIVAQVNGGAAEVARSFLTPIGTPPPPPLASSPLAAHVVASDVLATLESSDSEYPAQAPEAVLTIPTAPEDTTPSVISEDVSTTVVLGDGITSGADIEASSTIDVEESPTTSADIIKTHVSALFGAASAEDDLNTQEQAVGVDAGSALCDAEFQYAPLEGFEDSHEEARLVRLKLKMTLVKFLQSSYSLLLRSRKIFSDYGGSNGLSPGASEGVAVAGTNEATAAINKSSDTNSSMGPGAASIAGVSQSSTAALPITVSSSSLAQNSLSPNTTERKSFSGVKGLGGDPVAFDAVWQAEMEREYNNLVEELVPLLSGVAVSISRF